MTVLAERILSFVIVTRIKPDTDDQSTSWKSKCGYILYQKKNSKQNPLYA
jgi:hypothetical protein